MPNQHWTAFLSYAKEDSAKAQLLYNTLTSAGISIWFDQECLDPGMKWKHAIVKAIRNSRYFIALLSEQSVSKKGYVQSEINQAIEVLDQYPGNETYVVPVRLDECSPSHEKLNDLHWVDLFPDSQHGISKLLRFFGAEVSRFDQAQRDIDAIPIVLNQLAPTVRIDGIYASEKSSSQDYYKHLRFYFDGTVIVASSPQSALEVLNWFTKEWAYEHDYASKGQYNISGNTIRFASESSEGVIDYEGSIDGNVLILRSHSHINGNRGVSEFILVPDSTKLNAS